MKILHLVYHLSIQVLHNAKQQWLTTMPKSYSAYGHDPKRSAEAKSWLRPKSQAKIRVIYKSCSQGVLLSSSIKRQAKVLHKTPAKARMQT